MPGRGCLGDRVVGVERGQRGGDDEDRRRARRPGGLTDDGQLGEAAGLGSPRRPGRRRGRGAQEWCARATRAERLRETLVGHRELHVVVVGNRCDVGLGPGPGGRRWRRVARASRDPGRVEVLRNTVDCEGEGRPPDPNGPPSAVGSVTLDRERDESSTRARDKAVCLVGPRDLGDDGLELGPRSSPSTGATAPSGDADATSTCPFGRT